MAPVEIERVRISRGRMRVEVRVREDAPLRTSPEMAALALKARPELAAHSCINAKGPAFGDVIDDTTLPHLLEHLIIAEQARLLADAAAESRASQGQRPCDTGEASEEAAPELAPAPADVPVLAPAFASAPAPAAAPAPPPTLVGTTQLARDRRAVIEVSFVDDLVAVEALNSALEVLYGTVTGFLSRC